MTKTAIHELAKAIQNYIESANSIEEAMRWIDITNCLRNFHLLAELEQAEKNAELCQCIEAMPKGACLRRLEPHGWSISGGGICRFIRHSAEEALKAGIGLDAPAPAEPHKDAQDAPVQESADVKQ